MTEFLRREDTFRDKRDTVAFYHAKPLTKRHTYGIGETKDGRFFLYTYASRNHAVSLGIPEEDRTYCTDFETAKVAVALLGV